MDEMTDTIQNLLDAGCTDEQIRQFRECARNGSSRAQSRLLRTYRTILLDRLHESQSRLDCLDFLIYRIKKEDKIL